MTKGRYHIEHPYSPIYIEVVRVKYQNDEYFKAHVRFKYKFDDSVIQEQRNIKVYKHRIQHWLRY